VASRIERIEREFIIGSASEAGTMARIHGSGHTFHCRLERPTKELVRFASKVPEDFSLRPYEVVSVYFDFQGQSMAFVARVKRSSRGLLEIDWPDAMHRSLSRRWPRIAFPRGLGLSIILPDAALDLHCPICREYYSVETPAIESSNLGDSLDALVKRFREKASTMAADCRVSMFKEGCSPRDPAEELAARSGRVVYVPSARSGLPIADPYPESRIVTRKDLEDLEGVVSLAGASRFGAYLAKRAEDGLVSALWCPISFYRYCIGVVHLENRLTHPKVLDFSAVDLAFEFARRLAFFLKRNGYYKPAKARIASEPKSEAVVTIDGSPVSILDASPSGARVSLRPEDPVLKQGSRIELSISHKGGSLLANARVARRGDMDGNPFYGLAFEGLGPEAEEILALGLYGETGEALLGQGG